MDHTNISCGHHLERDCTFGDSSLGDAPVFSPVAFLFIHLDFDHFSTRTKCRKQHINFSLAVSDNAMETELREQVAVFGNYRTDVMSDVLKGGMALHFVTTKGCLLSW